MILEKAKLGISPINWVNEDIPSLGDHYTFEDLMHDFSELGFQATENSRKFPKDPVVLRESLAAHGLRIASQWKGVLFSDRDRREEELESYRQHVLFLKQLGAEHVVTCELGGSIIGDPRRPAGEKEVIPLASDQWDSMVEGLHEAGRICKENGMKLVYHHHMGTVVEKPEEIDRLMETTDPELVHLLLDTGHAYYGGYDPLEMLRKHADRVAYVHLKDIRQEVLAKVRQSSLSFLESIPLGVFTVPGDGCIDFAPIFRLLHEKGYGGWMIIEAEQDPSKANPKEYARKAKQYIGGLLLQSTV